MIKLLHSADIHLDAPFPSLGEKENQRRNDFLRTFERLLALASSWEADLFVIAGDLFDTPIPTAATLAKVQGGLQRLIDRGIVPVLLPGTHDGPAFPNSVYRRHRFPGCILLNNPQVTEPVPLEIRGEKIFLYGFAHRSAESAQALPSMTRRFPEGIHIGLLHGSRMGSREWDYRPKDLPFSLDDLVEWNLDYLALGHYHNFEVLDKNGRVLACYPGSPEGKRFGENGPRYTALVTVGREGVTVEKRVVNHRTLKEITLDLSGCVDLSSACQTIRSLGDPDLLLRLELTGTVETPIDCAYLQARVGGDFFHLQINDKTRFFDSRFVHRIADEDSVRGSFVRRIRSRMEKATEEERISLERAFREVMARFQIRDRGEA